MSVPIPNLWLAGTVAGIGTWEGAFAVGSNGYVNNANGTATFNYPTTINKSQVARLGTPAYTYLGPGFDVSRTLIDTGTMNGAKLAGDHRLLMITTGTIPNSVFSVGPATAAGAAPTATTFLSGCMRLGRGESASQNINNGSIVPSIPTANYINKYLPEFPAQSLGPNGPGSGDWDTGPGVLEDGPWCNKPDEGQYPGVGVTPYIGTYDSEDKTGTQLVTLFSPNRQISSPVMFGSLPVGPQYPWRTLLFRPANLPGYHGGYTHDGGTPASTRWVPDHVLLDWFWMPVVEPYGISEPLATSGKINLNYQIAPFTYITRRTGMDAVLKSVMITAMNPNAQGGNNNSSNFSSTYKCGMTDSTQTLNVKVRTRYAVDPDQTLSQLEVPTSDGAYYPEFARTSHTLANPNFFRFRFTDM